MDTCLLGASGLKVARIHLGCMTLGHECDLDLSFRILDRYVAAGGNVLDTANNYVAAEETVGKWLRERGGRDQLVISTKVRFPIEPHGPNDVGLTRKHLLQSVERSLKRLQTDYLDLYLAHCWDHATPIDETLRTFDDLIRQGKVRYIGASNFAGWHLAKSLERSAARGWAGWINLQSQYSLLCRSPEWEILPACRDYQVGLTAWSPLAAGWLSGKYRRDQPPPVGTRMGDVASTAEEWKKFVETAVNTTVPHPHRLATEDEFRQKRNAADAERRWRIVDAVIDVAKQRGKTPSQVALAWLLAKPGVTGPVIGVRSMTQLDDNLGCIGWTLDPQELAWLDQVSDPGLPYPHDFFKQYGFPWR